MIKNNIISSITGVVHNNPQYKELPKPHTIFEVEVVRKGGYIDLVNVITTEDVNICKGDCVRVTGFIFSYNNLPGVFPKLVVGIWANAIIQTPTTTDKNVALCVGTIVKKPQYRLTPLGTRICDVLIAVNNNVPEHYASYIPCIVWNDLAEIVKNYDVGTNLYIIGRLQSRGYKKVVGDVELALTTRELSVNDFQKINTLEDIKYV